MSVSERLRTRRGVGGRRQHRQLEGRLLAGEGLQEGDDLRVFVGAEFRHVPRARALSPGARIRRPPGKTRGMASPGRRPCRRVVFLLISLCLLARLGSS